MLRLMDSKEKLPHILVECDVFHVYSRNEVEIRTRLFERVDHVVRHVGANTSLFIYPPDRNDGHQYVWETKGF